MKSNQAITFLPSLLLKKLPGTNANADYFRNRFSKFRILVMPGLHGSGLDHWQTAWELWYPEFQRIEQSDWEKADLDVWARNLIEHAADDFRPIVVVAHSFGCLATVRASLLQPGIIAGALLVAPADPDRFNVEPLLPSSTLGLQTTIVASTNDPFMRPEVAEKWAKKWGSNLLMIRDAGHINVQSGHRDWPWGLELLEEVCQRVLNINVGNSKKSGLTG
jgi:predicted alpha/beta hydrolase family esterase